MNDKKIEFSLTISLILMLSVTGYTFLMGFAYQPIRLNKPATPNIYWLLFALSVLFSATLNLLHEHPEMLMEYFSRLKMPKRQSKKPKKRRKKKEEKKYPLY